MSAGPAEARLADLLAVLALWRRQSVWLALGLALSLVAVAAGVALLTRSAHTIVIALLGGVLLGAGALRWVGSARVVLRYLERLATHTATFRALADLRVWFFRGLSSRAAGGLGFRRAGDVLSRLVNDVEALDGLYLRILIPLAAGVLLLPILLVVLWGAAPGLALIVAGLFAAAAAAVPWWAARAAVGGGGAQSIAMGELRVAALDLLGGLREARANGAEARMLAAVLARQGAHQSASAELARRAARAQAVAFMAAQAAVLAVLVAVGGHAITPAGAVTILFLTVAAFEAVALLPRAGALAGHAAASAARVMQAATGPEPVAAPIHPLPLPADTALRFEQIHFAWRPGAPAVFDGLVLDMPRDSRIAVLGPSGAGKSTLAALALKVAAPQSGRITLGGTDIAGLRAEDVRQRISWLSQATHLFDDTIRANLLLARPTATEPELWSVLETAQLADLVGSLPNALDTWIGEAGAQFSGGQGRRLALARTLLSNAPILILDEPCAGLDAETEQAFHATLNTIRNRSILLIAHRLTGAERVDRIYRISGGHAVAAAA